MVEFVTPDVFKFGSLKSDKPKKASKPRERKAKRLPAHLKGHRVETVPAVDTEECQVDVYVAHCPVEECGHVSGRYISPRSARLALYGHFRWRHNWLA